MRMEVRISKWGSDLDFRVPRNIAVRSGLRAGMLVDIEASTNGRIIITPPKRRYTLGELIAEMKPEREHGLDNDDPLREELR